MPDPHYSTTLRQRAGDDWSISLTGLGDLSAAEELVFAIKPGKASVDADADLIVTLGTGAERVAGSTWPTAAYASITVDDEANGNITIAVAAAITVELEPRADAIHAVKSIPAGGGGTTLRDGRMIITESLIDQITP